MIRIISNRRKSYCIPYDLYTDLYDLYTDSITYFRSVSVIKTSTGVLTRNNMKARNEWDFTIIDDENATYTLKIDNIDF